MPRSDEPRGHYFLIRRGEGPHTKGALALLPNRHAVPKEEQAGTGVGLKNIMSRYESLQRNNITGDVEFIVMEKFLSADNELPFLEKLVMKVYFWLKAISLSEERGFGLDPSYVKVEKFPLIVAPVTNIRLKRLDSEES